MEQYLHDPETKESMYDDVLQDASEPRTPRPRHALLPAFDLSDFSPTFTEPQTPKVHREMLQLQARASGQWLSPTSSLGTVTPTALHLFKGLTCPSSPSPTSRIQPEIYESEEEESSDSSDDDDEEYVYVERSPSVLVEISPSSQQYLTPSPSPQPSGLKFADRLRRTRASERVLKATRSGRADLTPPATPTIMLPPIECIPSLEPRAARSSRRMASRYVSDDESEGKTEDTFELKSEGEPELDLDDDDYLSATTMGPKKARSINKKKKATAPKRNGEDRRAQNKQAQTKYRKKGVAKANLNASILKKILRIIRSPNGTMGKLQAIDGEFMKQMRRDKYLRAEVDNWITL